MSTGVRHPTLLPNASSAPRLRSKGARRSSATALPSQGCLKDVMQHSNMHWVHTGVPREMRNPAHSFAHTEGKAKRVAVSTTYPNGFKQQTQQHDVSPANFSHNARCDGVLHLLRARRAAGPALLYWAQRHALSLLRNMKHTPSKVLVTFRPQRSALCRVRCSTGCGAKSHTVPAEGLPAV